MREHYDAYRYEINPQGIAGTRWASEDEVREKLSRVNLHADHYSACGLPLISDGHTAYVNNADSHSLILGSTGSKKSRLFVMPMMEMIARAGESVLCTDPKGELYERTSGLFAQEGYNIMVLNLRDPLRSDGWNPLFAALRYKKKGNFDMVASTISDLSNSIFPTRPRGSEDPFWNQKSRALFQGLSHMLFDQNLFSEDQVSLSGILTLADAISTDEITYVSEDNTNALAMLYPKHSQARINMDSTLQGSEKTRMNIVTSFASPMQIFTSRQTLLKMLSTNQIDFESLGLKKSILYIIMPDEKTTLHMLVSLAIKQCYETLIETAQSCKGLTLPIRVNFLLDEFSNLPTIPDMNAMISAARSRNIRFYLIIQSLHQLDAKYGEDSHTIRGNCNDWVYLTSRELTLLQELEALCGHDARTNIPLISVSQLQRLNKETGEALVLCGRMYPYLSHLADIDQYPFAHLPPQPLPHLPKVSAESIDIEAVMAKARELYTEKLF